VSNRSADVEWPAAGKAGRLAPLGAHRPCSIG
jgi:hypothetical protein